MIVNHRKKLKNKILHVILILAILMIETSCGSQNKVEKNNESIRSDSGSLDTGIAEKIELSNFIPDEQVKIFEAEQTQLSSPTDICVFDNELVVGDQEQHCLFRYNLDCEYIGTIGRQGMAPMEFSTPMALDTYEEKLYVLDSGNNRIQILNKRYEFVDEIYLETLNLEAAGVIYTDLAVADEDHIYVCVSCSSKFDNYIYLINNQGQSKIETVFYGCLSSDSGNVYAMNTLEYVYIDETLEYFVDGTNEAFLVEPSAITCLFRLPNQYSPQAFVKFKNYFIIVSSCWSRIDLFNENGEIVRAIYNIGYLALNDVYIDITDKGVLYVISNATNQLLKIELYEEDFI